MDPAALFLDERYKTRLYRRYLGMTLIPVFFFVVLAAVSIVISQRFVGEEITAINLKNLKQTRDAAEVVFNETDSLALSLATDPEFFFTAKKLLDSGLVTLEDVKLRQNLVSGLTSTINTRPYLHSIYVYLRSHPDRLIINSEGVVPLNTFPDAEWTERAVANYDGLSYWMEDRELPILPSLPLSRKVISLYRNMISASSLQSTGIIVVNINAEYLERLLDSSKSTEAQSFAVLKRDGAFLLGSPDRRGILGELSRQDRRDRPEWGALVERFHAGLPYVSTYLPSNRYPFVYMTAVPKNDFFRLYHRLRDLGILFAALSFVLGLGITIYTTKRNFRNIERIIDIMRAAERDEKLPEPSEMKHDSFYSLTYGILKTFLDRNYLKLRETTLELRALQSQMNPHFLFNTMTAISCRALEFTGRPNDVTSMIDRLSRILAYSLDNPREGVTLREEIEFTRHYLDIQRVRYRGRFDVDWRIDEKAGGCRVVKLLLQPLVENAIYHGIQQKGERGLITIEAGAEKDKLVVAVKDDGAGIPKEKMKDLLARLESSSEIDGHVGLANTAKRLKLFFGGKAEFRLSSEPGRGTAVVISMPALITPIADRSFSAAGEKSRNTF